MIEEQKTVSHIPCELHFVCDDNHRHAIVAEVAKRLQNFFNEFAVRAPGNANALIDKLATLGVIGGVALSRLNPHAGMDDVFIACATEMNTDHDIAAFAKALKGAL